MSAGLTVLTTAPLRDRHHRMHHQQQQHHHHGHRRQQPQQPVLLRYDMPSLLLLLLTLLLMSLASTANAYLQPDYSTWSAPQTPARVSGQYNLKWMAPVFSGGGYCSEALSFVAGLHEYVNTAIEQHGDSLNWQFFQGLPEATRELLTLLSRKAVRPSATIAVCHSEPGAWDPPNYSTSLCPPRGSAYTIGRTMFETDRLPSGWAARLNKMDEVWVPTRFHADIFSRDGVNPVKILIVPEPVDTARFSRAHIHHFDLPGALQTTYKFLSVFKWEYRKGWDVLLRAYLTEFTSRDDVALYILTSAYHSSSNFNAAIDQFVRENLPDVDRATLAKTFVLTEIPDDELPSMYAAVDAFVLPSRGEGWGRPHVEAMAMELPIIATNWSGPTEFMTTQNSYPLAYTELKPIPDGAFKGHLMAEPSVDHLRQLMRHVMNNREEAVAKGRQARRDMVARYSPNQVAQFVVHHLNRIVDSLQQEL